MDVNFHPVIVYQQYKIIKITSDYHQMFIVSCLDFLTKYCFTCGPLKLFVK